MNASMDNQGAASLLRELRDRDTETGLLTSVRIYRVLLGEIARSDRYGNPLSCILLQLTGLESLPAEARLALSSRLADVMRNTDFAGVWDHEAFLLVLPETSDEGARMFSRKVEQALDDLIRTSNRIDESAVSINARVTTWQSGDDADALLNRLLGPAEA